MMDYLDRRQIKSRGYCRKIEAATPKESLDSGSIFCSIAILPEEIFSTTNRQFFLSAFQLTDFIKP
jgi:hypothetical protein